MHPAARYIGLRTTILVNDPIANDTLALMSRVQRLSTVQQSNVVNGFPRAWRGEETRRGNAEKEKSWTDGLSHAPPPRESSKRLVFRFKCPGIYWVGQIQQPWPLPRPPASLHITARNMTNFSLSWLDSSAMFSVNTFHPRGKNSKKSRMRFGKSTFYFQSVRNRQCSAVYSRM